MSSTRQPPQTPQQRDMVYCHQCENEWYRDEHGLTCPECQSDFTEIIEADHDPRDDNLPDLEPPTSMMPGGMGGGHGPEHGDFYGAPDPDEEDIDGFHWQQTGPGQMHGTFNRTFTLGGGSAQGGQQQGGGGLGGGLSGLIGSMIGNALSGLSPQAQQQAHQQAEQQIQQQLRQHQQQRDDQRPQSPDVSQGNRASSAPSEPRNGTTVRHYHSPFGHMTVATSSNFNSNLHPRNANQPQAFQNQPQAIDEMMNQMFFNIGGGRTMMGAGSGMGMGGGMGGHQHGPFGARPGGPFGNLFQMLGLPGGGRMGDAVFSQEDLDRVITQLMEQHQSGNAPGPATEQAIKSLPKRAITEKDLGDGGKADCSICMDEAPLGSEVTYLPCSHWFHEDCIRAWLSEHDTCPHCRQGIMPKDGQGARAPDQAPRHDMSNPPPPSVPGTFPGQGSGQGSGSGEAPGMHRRASSTSAAERRPSAQAGGSGRSGPPGVTLMEQFRNAFGGGSGNGGNSGSGARPGSSGGR